MQELSKEFAESIWLEMYVLRSLLSMRNVPEDQLPNEMALANVVHWFEEQYFRCTSCGLDFYQRWYESDIAFEIWPKELGLLRERVDDSIRHRVEFQRNSNPDLAELDLQTRKAYSMMNSFVNESWMPNAFAWVGGFFTKFECSKCELSFFPAIQIIKQYEN